MRVPLDSVLALTQALEAVGMSQRRNVYWAARTTLVRRPEDHGVFDRAFQVFFDHRYPGGDDQPEPEPLKLTIVIDSDDEEDNDGADDESDGSDDPQIHLRFLLPWQVI